MGFRVIKGGMLTTVQDFGRTGYQSQGFSVGGAMDVRSFKLANLLHTPIIDITTPFLSERHYGDLFCDDGIHPNAAGHQLIAETICNYAQHYL